MSQSTFSLDISVQIAADLSAAQYHFVKISGADNQVVLATAQGETILGILQEPVDGSTTTKAGLVRILGKSKLVYGGTLTRGTDLTTAADGEGDTAAADDTVAAYALESGLDQDIKHVVLRGGGEFQN